MIDVPSTFSSDVRIAMVSLVVGPKLVNIVYTPKDYNSNAATTKTTTTTTLSNERTNEVLVRSATKKYGPHRRPAPAKSLAQRKVRTFSSWERASLLTFISTSTYVNPYSAHRYHARQPRMPKRSRATRSSTTFEVMRMFPPTFYFTVMTHSMVIFTVTGIEHFGYLRLDKYSSVWRDSPKLGSPSGHKIWGRPSGQFGTASLI